MPIDPPKIDREVLLREEAAARRREQCFRQVMLLLKEQEHLGTPVREGNLILLPVLTEDPPVESRADVPSYQALLKAWMEEG